jgi:putative transposase
VKKSLLVEADGGPLGIVVAGANVPDAQLLAATLDAVVLERPPIEPGYEQHLCLDKAYDNDTGWGACLDADYQPHSALIRDERPPRPAQHPARRWVVERTLAWLSRFRRLTVRYDRLADLHLAFLDLACALICLRLLQETF